MGPPILVETGIYRANRDCTYLRKPSAGPAMTMMMINNSINEFLPFANQLLIFCCPLLPTGEGACLDTCNQLAYNRFADISIYVLETIRIVPSGKLARVGGESR